jgi:hypothetical protein
METVALKIIGYGAVGLVMVRLAIVGLAIPAVWGSGLYMLIRMIARHGKQGVRG